MIIPKDCEECLIGEKFNDKWIEISQGEYRRLKREDPNNCNKYTARIEHKYYKAKQEFPIEVGDKWLQAVILENGLTLNSDMGLNNIWIGKKDGSRFRVLKRAIEIMEKE